MDYSTRYVFDTGIQPPLVHDRGDQQDTVTRGRSACNGALHRMKRYVAEKEMIHYDVNPANVLGDVEFVGWGCWENMAIRAEPLLHF
jgi:hypothetical protein